MNFCCSSTRLKPLWFPQQSKYMKKDKFVEVSKIQKLINEFKQDIEDNNQYIKKRVKSGDYYEAAHYARYNDVNNYMINRLNELTESK